MHLLLLFLFLIPPPNDPPAGLFFHFKGRPYALTRPMRPGPESYLPRGRFDEHQLDTLSNRFDSRRNHVEIIRQDDGKRPRFGVALAFEFDEENGDYPYTPAYAMMQLKDFGWGGVEFDARDTCNYTGVSNAVSDDLFIEIDDYRNDTIFGRFSGLLLSGAGGMATLDSGYFAVRVYRVR